MFVCATLYWAKVTLTLFTSMYIINPKDTKNSECDICTYMALQVIEFQDQGYKIRFFA